MVQTIHKDTSFHEEYLAFSLFLARWFVQTQALYWKELLAALRRPFYVLSQILTPAIMIALLGYGASVAPKFDVPAWSFSTYYTVDTMSLNPAAEAAKGLPDVAADFTSTSWESLASTVSDAQTVLDKSFSSEYFLDQQLPAYIAVSDDDRKYEPSMSIVNAPAAKPFLIPSLSSFLVQREAMRAHVGRLGLKSYAVTNDFIWHLFNKGKIVFYPSSDLVDELVTFLLNTSDASLKEYIQPFTPNAFTTGMNFGYPNVYAALNSADPRSGGDGIAPWAVVYVKSLEISAANNGKLAIDYTIMMNQTMVPATDRVIERFPRGLGTKYADYLYSGYTVLQRAINNFAARKARKFASAAGMVPLADSGALMSPIDLALSACPDTAMYEQPPNAQQAAVVRDLLEKAGPSVKAIVAPSEEPSANAPCLREVMLHCRDAYTANDEDALLLCMRGAPMATDMSAVCSTAMTFLETNTNGSAVSGVSGSTEMGDCLATAFTCSSFIGGATMTVSEFLTGIAGPNRPADSPLITNMKCLDLVSPAAPANSYCTNSTFAQLLEDVTTASIDICFSDVNMYCATYRNGASCWNAIGGCDYGPLQCLQQAIKDGKTLTTPCRMLVDAVPKCLDDLHSVCPWDKTAKMSSFPSLCLHMNDAYLSSTCYQSTFRQFQLNRYFATGVTFVTEDRATATCKAGHDLEFAFSPSASVAAVAMPTRKYTQQPFFENLGPLAGLIVAISFTVPFCAIVRRIVEDRAFSRRAYLLLIGAHHSAIIVADGIVGFVYMLFAVLIAIVSLDTFLLGSSKGMLLGILFTYAMSLTAFATFIASLFNNPKTANSVAPMLLFLTALPSYVTLTDLDWVGALLPPAIAARSFNIVVEFSLATANHSYGYDIAVYCAAMFGQWILYCTLTFFVEYLRVMGFGFGWFYNTLYTVKGYMSSSRRLVVRPLRTNAVYQQLSGQDYTGTNRWRQAVRESDLEDDEEGGTTMTIITSSGNQNDSLSGPPDTALRQNPHDIEFGDFNNASGSVPLTEEYPVAETPMNNRTDYSIGGVANDANVNGSTVIPEDLHQRRGAKAVSARFVDLQNVSYTTRRIHHGTVQTTSDVTASLYRNRVNVVIGPGGSGKTSLMRVLSGQTCPTVGQCLIEEEDARFYNRRNVGVCLQRDVTWDTLSVMEHLELIQHIKGFVHPRYESVAERIALCESLQLDASASLFADALPTGTLRRLSVAMAFAGGSKYVVLDEPTTAVDANGRRCMWRLFNENAVGRCLVVATTNVEEAESSEHVLLMHRGTLKASGSPQFLKKHLGGGCMIVSVARGQYCNASTIITRVRAICPRTKLVNNVGQELSFRVDPEDFHCIPELVADLENATAENDIVSVSVADSRLDELFMMCVREYDVMDGTAMPGSDGKFEAENAAAEAETATDSSVAAPAAATTNDDYVSQEAAATTVTRARAPSSSSPGRRRGEANAAAPGTSSRHVQASDVIPVDPEWFKTLKYVGTDRERKLRTEGFSLVFRNISTVLVHRLTALMAEVVGSALEFLIPLFAVMFAVNIMTTPVEDPPSLLLTPHLYNYNKIYFASSDNQLADAINGKLYSGDMIPSTTSNEPTGLFEMTKGRYRFVRAGDDKYDGVALSLTFEASYDNHDLAEFMGGYAFADRFANTRITNPETRLPVAPGVNWRSSLIIHNTSTPHAIPVFVNVFDSTRIQQMTTFKTVQLLGRSDPYAAGETARMASTRAILAILGTILVLVPFSFFPGIFALQVVSERQNGALAMMTASKLSPFSYWIGTFIWHMMRFLFFSVTAIFAITYGGARPLLGDSSSTIETFGLFLLYGCCSLSMAYLISRFFKDALAAQTFITVTNFTFGVVCVVAINALDMMSGSNIHTKEAAVAAAKGDIKDRRDFFRIVPAYALGEGLLKITSLDFFQSTDASERFSGDKSTTSIFAVLGWTFPFYLAALIIFDGSIRITCIRLLFGAYGLVRDGMLVVFSPCIPKSNTVGNNSGDPLRREPWQGNLAVQREGEDPSVTTERQKGPCPDGVTVKEAWRKYTGFGSEHNIYAVKGASFSVAPGDRLAVVGANGSGKTTLMNLMGGVLMPSVGEVEIKMRSLTKSTLSHWWGRSFTGFSNGTAASVPEDATPYVLLHLMADFRAMARDVVREGHIAHLLHTLGLLTAFNTPISTMSASMKRRVGVAMAIVGFPPIIYLDEPTVGMDPVGRRMTWAVLNLIPSRCALVLSTHRLDDVEMVANRVCLLQQGNVAFINDAHVAKQNAHLKGVILNIHFNIKMNGVTGAGGATINPLADSLAGTPTSNAGGSPTTAPPPSQPPVETYWVKNDVMEFILRTFPGSVLLEDRNNTDLKFHLCAEDASDDTLFRPRDGAGSVVAGTFGRQQPNTAPPLEAASPHVGRDLLDTGREDEEAPAGAATVAADGAGAGTASLLQVFPAGGSTNNAIGANNSSTSNNSVASIRSVFEKLHQKRVELMLQGIYGAPVSAPTSAATDRNRSATHRTVFSRGEGGRPNNNNGTTEADRRHRQEIHDLLGPSTAATPSSTLQTVSVGTLLGGGATSPIVGDVSSSSAAPRAAAASASLESPSDAVSSSSSSKIMPFDIVITKSAIDQVLDKVLGGAKGGETAALERFFQNTSARVEVREW